MSEFIGLSGSNSIASIHNNKRASGFLICCRSTFTFSRDLPSSVVSFRRKMIANKNQSPSEQKRFAILVHHKSRTGREICAEIGLNMVLRCKMIDCLAMFNITLVNFRFVRANSWLSSSSSSSDWLLVQTSKPIHLIWLNSETSQNCVAQFLVGAKSCQFSASSQFFAADNLPTARHTRSLFLQSPWGFCLVYLNRNLEPAFDVNLTVQLEDFAGNLPGTILARWNVAPNVCLKNLCFVCIVAADLVAA